MPPPTRKAEKGNRAPDTDGGLSLLADVVTEQTSTGLSMLADVAMKHFAQDPTTIPAFGRGAAGAVGRGIGRGAAGAAAGGKHVLERSKEEVKAWEQIADAAGSGLYSEEDSAFTLGSDTVRCFGSAEEMREKMKALKGAKRKGDVGRGIGRGAAVSATVPGAEQGARPYQIRRTLPRVEQPVDGALPTYSGKGKEPMDDRALPTHSGKGKEPMHNDNGMRSPLPLRSCDAWQKDVKVQSLVASALNVETADVEGMNAQLMSDIMHNKINSRNEKGINAILRLGQAPKTLPPAGQLVAARDAVPPAGQLVPARDAVSTSHIMRQTQEWAKQKSVHPVFQSRVLALFCGLHRRLGKECTFRMLDITSLQLIVSYAFYPFSEYGMFEIRRSELWRDTKWWWIDTYQRYFESPGTPDSLVPVAQVKISHIEAAQKLVARMGIAPDRPYKPDDFQKWWRGGPPEAVNRTMTYREQLRKVRVQESLKLDMADMETGRGFKQLTMEDLQQVHFSYKHMLYVLGLCRHPEKGGSSNLFVLDDEVFKIIIELAYPEHFERCWKSTITSKTNTTSKAPIIIKSHSGGARLGNGSANAKDAFAYALQPVGQGVMPYATNKNFIGNIHTILRASGALMYDCDELIKHTLNLPNVIIFPKRGAWLQALKAYDANIAKTRLLVDDDEDFDNIYSERVLRMFLDCGYCTAPRYPATPSVSRTEEQLIQEFPDHQAYDKFFEQNFLISGKNKYSGKNKFHKILLFDATSWNSGGFRNFMKDCARCTPRNCVDRMIKAIHDMHPSWFKIYPYNIASRYRSKWCVGFDKWVDCNDGVKRWKGENDALASYDANLIGMAKHNWASTY